MTDRLQQKAEQLVMEKLTNGEDYLTAHRFALAGLTAGIAMAAEPGQAQILAAAQAMWECNQTASYPFSSEVPHVREYWIIRAELVLAAALAKGETQTSSGAEAQLRGEKRGLSHPTGLAGLPSPDAVIAFLESAEDGCRHCGNTASGRRANRIHGAIETIKLVYADAKGETQHG